MAWRLVRAALILPGTVPVLVPAALLWLTRGTALEARPVPAADPRFGLALLLAGAGLALALWIVRLFVTAGRGTPAPWDPPRRLVVRGPYR